MAVVQNVALIPCLLKNRPLAAHHWIEISSTANHLHLQLVPLRNVGFFLKLQKFPPTITYLLLIRFLLILSPVPTSSVSRSPPPPRGGLCNADKVATEAG